MVAVPAAQHRRWRRPATSISTPGDLWSDDFAASRSHRQGLFIHEMTHVWQAQTRGRFYLPLMRHPFCRYRYALEPGRPFDRYGLEQQAEIVRHAFLAERGYRLRALPAARRFCRSPESSRRVAIVQQTRHKVANSPRSPSPRPIEFRHIRRR